ncbi:hypothetical protein RHO13_02855 [Orbus wheelerorum]|uniref:alpha/beta hydrolase family protein n=1 Tax=Orbus wheelerorum TaxID=3074111 RepID=UPI00370D6ED1
MKQKYYLFFIIIFIYSTYLHAGPIFKGTGISQLDNSQDPPLIFYPSNTKNQILFIDGYEIDASKSINIADDNGNYPIVIISHGTASSKLSHHNIASALAKYGYIVITLNHSKDNYKNQSSIENNNRLFTRVNDISDLIDSLSKSSWKDRIDLNNINFLGFSAGGSTGLFLAGGQFDIDNFIKYCQVYTTQNICLTINNIASALPNFMSIKPDDRIKSIILISPVSFFFSDLSLKKIKLPSIIIGGENDHEISAQRNFIDLYNKLNNKKNKLILIRNAGHFSFLPTCSEQFARNNPDLCIDSPYINRSVLTNQLVNQIHSFLLKNKL